MEICAALVSRHLQDMSDPSLWDIARFTEKVPESVIPFLLKDLLNGRGSVSGDPFEISCIVKTPLFGPAKPTLQVSVRLTDSVHYLYYLVGKCLGVMAGAYKLNIFFRGKRLERGDISISSLGFTSDTVLEVDEFRCPSSD